MNNNITEDYCSFEVSSAIWKKEGRLKSDKNFTYSNSHPNGTGWYEDLNNSHLSISRPTHALAIKWIRENFGYHIYVVGRPFSYSPTITPVSESAHKKLAGSMKQLVWTDSNESAVEAALLYTLKNLI